MPKKIKLSDVPTVTPVDELILITEEMISDLKLRLSELKALRRPYRGRFEPAVHPVTGEICSGRSKRKYKKKPAPV